MCTITYLRIFLVMAVVGSSHGYVVRATDDVTKDTELVFAFMVHRHGDRTPVESALFLLGNYEAAKVRALIEPWGYGELTDSGKRTAYNIGKFIRRRYHSLLAPKYNYSEVYIRSTDSNRSKMTVLTAMSAVYPAVGKTWSDRVNWVPTPYTTVPDKYDYNLATVNCPVFSKFYFEKFEQYDSRMAPYADVIAKISKITGKDITKTPLRVKGVYDLFVSLISLGFEVGDDVKTLLPKLEEASGVAWDVTCGEEEYIALEAGVFLNEFFKHANRIIAGNETQRVRIYSGHDFNVYVLQVATLVQPRQGSPKYGSLFSLELRRNTKTGRYYVLPVYLSDPNEGVEKYLEVKDCGSLCEFHTFYGKTSKYLLDEKTWRTRCDFKEDFIVTSF